jgi:hypothetical protein
MNISSEQKEAYRIDKLKRLNLTPVSKYRANFSYTNYDDDFCEMLRVTCDHDNEELKKIVKHINLEIHNDPRYPQSLDSIGLISYFGRSETIYAQLYLNSNGFDRLSKLILTQKTIISVSLSLDETIVYEALQPASAFEKYKPKIDAKDFVWNINESFEKVIKEFEFDFEFDQNHN